MVLDQRMRLGKVVVEYRDVIFRTEAERQLVAIAETALELAALVLDFDVESVCVLFRQIELKFYSFDTLRSLERLFTARFAREHSRSECTPSIL